MCVVLFWNACSTRNGYVSVCISNQLKIRLGKATTCIEPVMIMNSKLVAATTNKADRRRWIPKSRISQHTTYFVSCFALLARCSTATSTFCRCYCPITLGDGGTAGDQRAPEPGQLHRAWNRVVERKEVVKERAAHKFHSWTVQNEMRSVLGRMTIGAARRILNSSNARKIRMYLSQSRRESTQQA